MPTVACRDLANTFTQANTFQATVTFNAAGGLTNNILIGADSTYPTYGLLSFNGALTDAGFVGFAGGGGGGDLWVQAVANMHLRTGGNVEHLTILSSGNIGIGTTSPSAITHLVNPLVSASQPSQFVDQYSGSSGTGISTNPLIFRAARGTPTSPSAVQSGDTLGGYNVRGYGATGFATGGRAGVTSSASDNWTDTDQGAQIKFTVTPNGSVAAFTALTLANNGYLGFGTPTQQITNPQIQIHLPTAASVGWDNGSGTPDIGLSRGYGGMFYVGNGTPGDTSGSLLASTLFANVVQLGWGSDTSVSRYGPGQVAIGTGAQGNYSGGLLVNNVQTNTLTMINNIAFWSGSSLDAGLSRGGVAQINAGNGTNGDASGYFNAAGYKVGGAALAFSHLASHPTTIAGYGISDVGSYAPSLTGTGASGTWSISITGSSASCTGNAASATYATYAA